MQIHEPIQGTVEVVGPGLAGDLSVPSNSEGLIVFVQGCGSQRLPTQQLGLTLYVSGFATLHLDLLSKREQEAGRKGERHADVDRLTRRLIPVVQALGRSPQTRHLPLGLLGLGAGSAAALRAAAAAPGVVRAVVCQGGRPDGVSASVLAQVQAPTLWVVGGRDPAGVKASRGAQGRLSGLRHLEVIQNASRRFTEPGAARQAAFLACDWFTASLTGRTHAW